MPELSNAFAFGPFVLIPEQALLLEGQRSVRIGQRAFDVLTLLVEAHGQVVGKRSLLARAWPGLVVQEGNLKVTIAAIRRLLGEGADADAPRYIATVVGRGYRFIAPVRHDSSHASATSQPRPPGNLPQTTRRIHGREAVIDAIRHDFGATRLVSVVGPGGVGKSTVALAAAQRAAAAFKDGCWRVDLARTERPFEVAEAIADVTGVRAGAGDPAMLIVLDNCEHLVGAVALCVDQLLCSTRNLSLLVTSREPLCIRSERVRRLPGLGLPPQPAGIRAAAAAAYPAVQLFVERAAAASPSFRLDDANAATICAICQRLDGLALAIERVAERAGTLDVAAMLDHLARRFRMFDGFHEGPARHRTLTATVHASYVLLSPGEQASLRRLAIFDGAFSLEAACAVTCEQGAGRASVLDDIANLVAKSLLAAEPCDGKMAYRQAHVTRAFAFEQLVEHGELDQVQRLAQALGEAEGTDE